MKAGRAAPPFVARLVAAMIVFGTPAVRANGRYPAAGQIAADPNDARHLVARTTFGLLQSFDAGARWSWICESAISTAGFQDPEISIRPDGALMVALSDGLAIGDAAGCDWNRAEDLAGQNLVDLVQNTRSPTIAFAVASVTPGGSFQALVEITQDGDKWKATGIARPDTYPLTIESAPSRPQRLYLGAENADLDRGYVDVSDDGGATWARHDSPGGLGAVYVSGVDPTDPDRVYLRAYGPAGALYVSDDAANSWTMVASSTGPMTAFALSPDGTRMAIGDGDGVRVYLRSRDAGDTFALAATAPVPVNCLLWTATALYACGDERVAPFTIGRSADDGATFQSLLHLRQIAPSACPADTAGASCASSWCTTAASIGAACLTDASSALDAGTAPTIPHGAAAATPGRRAGAPAPGVSPR